MEIGINAKKNCSQASPLIFSTCFLNDLLRKYEMRQKFIELPQIKLDTIILPVFRNDPSFLAFSIITLTFAPFAQRELLRANIQPMPSCMRSTVYKLIFLRCLHYRQEKRDLMDLEIFGGLPSKANNLGEIRAYIIHFSNTAKGFQFYFRLILDGTMEKPFGDSSHFLCILRLKNKEPFSLNSALKINSGGSK